MRRLTAGLAALAIVAGCGSDDKKSTTGAQAPPTTSTSTLPPVQGKATKEKRASKDKSASNEEPARSGETIQTGNFYFFTTPSRKIGCAVTRDPDTLRCDTKYETSFSRSGRKCREGDYGHSFQVNASGGGDAICAGDTVFGATSSHTIPYGKTWLLGPFRCIARESGLTCQNGEGHGFALSVQSQRLL
jgi:hypothetical protein